MPEPELRPSESEVRAHLQRLLASPDFTASQRQRRFLEFVVEETLAGRADGIKAYSIAETPLRLLNESDVKVRQLES